MFDISLEVFRVEQQWFRALLGVLHTFGSGETETKSLRTLIEADCRWGELGSSRVPGMKGEEFSDLFSALKKQFHVHVNVLDWIKGIDLQTIRAASACVIEHLPIGVRTHLVCTRWRIEAGWDLYHLRQALRWMVWYDVFTQHPLICCPERRRVKRAKTTRGNQKFCKYKCAHRAAARAWQRKHYKPKGRARSARRKYRCHFIVPRGQTCM